MDDQSLPLITSTNKLGSPSHKVPSPTVKCGMRTTHPRRARFSYEIKESVVGARKVMAFLRYARDG